MNINTTKDLKEALRHGPYAWPGGYPTFFLCSDGECLSHESVKQNLRQCLYAIKHGERNGWRVVATDVNWEDPELYCSHSGKRIESAYAEDQAIPA